MDGYNIVGQTETSDIRPGIGFVQQVRVTFKTTSGVVGTVTVDRDAYSAATVKALIDDYVSHIDAVHKLS